MNTLIICLDGLSYKFISKENTPFLYSFANESYITRLKTLLAFTGIEFSFFSGKYPDEYNIWTQFLYSPKTSPFKFLKYLAFIPRLFLNYFSILQQYISGRTFLVKIENIPLDKINNFDTSVRYGVYKLPFFQNQSFLYYSWPLMIKNNKKSIDIIKRDDKYKAKRFIKNINKKINLYSIQLVEIDKIAHKYGVDSRKFRDKIREEDRIVEDIVKEFKKRFNKLNIFIWSDHGFVNVKGCININIWDCLCFYDSTLARFWFRDNKSREEVISKLNKIKNGHILSDEERKRYHIPLDRRYGDLIFLADPGYIIVPNYYQNKQRAMHGYAPDKADLDGMFITNKKVKKELEMVEVLKWMSV